MLDLQEFTKESIALRESLIGKPLYRAAGAGKDALKGALEFFRKNKPSAKAEKEAIVKLKDSLLGKAVIGTGKAVKGAAGLASKLVTSPKPGGGRQVNIAKTLLVGAPMYAAYKAAKKGGAKMRKPKYYGPRKSESVYVDPQRKLY